MITLAWLAAVVLALLALIGLGQRRLIYFPATLLPTPEDVGLSDVETVTYTTSDGLDLGGWFLRAAGDQPRPAVLVLNGNAGNRAYRAPLGQAMRRLGFHVLLTDYRGYGGNAGRPTEQGLALDSRAARAYLARRPDVDASRLVLFGESLGSAVAIELAVEHPPAALILRSPFTSLADIGAHHYRVLPVRWMLRDRFDSLARMARVQAPVLVIAGSRDSIVPIEYSERLHAAAREPKSLLVLAGADHNDDELLFGGEMMRGVASFVGPLVEP